MSTNSPAPNRLASEKSPYLLQHAHNPVDWMPWGEEAFSRARAEGKPIFLSIGYSTCHWCHVMAHESFENAATAELMNKHYVCVKVDREERPDVDKVYMTFVQASTGGGGWPMSVWLTPDLKPFLGGTYYPPEDRYGRPGFPTVLTKIAEVWEADRSRVTEQGEQMTQALREYAVSTPAADDAPGREILREAYNQIGRTFDDDDGGFGNAPKFPRPSMLNFLVRYYALEGQRGALEMALHTLRKMADGGMHDHLGGGFHRYSVDRFWHIPHFEKMLYDQAQLALSYLDAFQITRDVFHLRVARDILDYVQRDMTSPEGGFYSAEDADSFFEHGKPEHGEGAFYVWTKGEIDRALGEDAEFFNRAYDVVEEGNAPQGSDPQGEFVGKNTLILRVPPANDSEDARLRMCREKLLAIRNRRPRPHLDDKIITAWNGLMISAFARGFAVLDEPAYLDAAIQAAKFVRAHLRRDDGTLIRSYREGASAVAGFADDYASLIQGLIDLYEASSDYAWLEWALELQQKQDAAFADDKGGGYFSTRADAPDILIRMKEDYDGAEPSPNSTATLNLLRLSQITGDSALRDRAVRTLSAFSTQLQRMPSAVPQMLVALLFHVAAPKQIVLAGKPGAADVRALLDEVNAHFLPNKVIVFSDGKHGSAFTKTLTPMDGRATAYVCENFTCNLPVTDVAELRKIITPPYATRPAP